jgi:hypothetical protein
MIHSAFKAVQMDHARAGKIAVQMCIDLDAVKQEMTDVTADR